MSKSLAFTFRCPEPMRTAMEQIMEERNLDRTSVIKLALYLLCKTLKRREFKKKDLYQVVRLMEQMAPEKYMSFDEFIGD